MSCAVSIWVDLSADRGRIRLTKERKKKYTQAKTPFMVGHHLDSTSQGKPFMTFRFMYRSERKMSSHPSAYLF